MYFLFILLLIMLLLSVGFFTLMERKFLGYFQLRKGPSKVLFLGIFQPFSDGLKLFMKSDFSLLMSHKIMFFFFPVFMLFSMFLYWLVFNFFIIDLFFFSLIYILIISSLSVYYVLGLGWISNSKYGLLGAYRSMAQVVSYEVGLVFILMLLVILNSNYSLMTVINLNFYGFDKFLGFIFILFIWFVILLAELNRAPFDFSESESELVSGFNVEYGGIKFAFMFLGEYGNMIFMSYFTICMFYYFFWMGVIFYMIFMVWVRGVFPRYRYDNLMYLNWKIYLPFILMFYMSWYVCVYFFC
nr:NADH dehydrogenase subunit 1 [Amblyseius swirskii]